MFDRIARRYDLLNRLLSGGIDRRWRRRQVRALALGADARVLDLATGTGDVALAVARHHVDAEVVGIDPSIEMLEVGRDKVDRVGVDQRVRLDLGDAQNLPFEDNSFDATTIAFGIRNVPDRARALAEMARVTKTGGRVAILELSEPRSGWIAPLARFHIHRLTPWLGARLSGASEYAYLEKSIAAFPSPREFARQIADAGLRVLDIEPMTFGVVCLFVATPTETLA
ncbi:MAG: bifunctional demethylmenaquinone methyltransferase/2-methoxy-6-polyprenyl-1,4-benzoquinol methylase UbiE [Acidobacteriota bacterium]